MRRGVSQYARTAECGIGTGASAVARLYGAGARPSIGGDSEARRRAAPDAPRCGAPPPGPNGGTGKRGRNDTRPDLTTATGRGGPPRGASGAPALEPGVRLLRGGLYVWLGEEDKQAVRGEAPAGGPGSAWWAAAADGPGAPRAGAARARPCRAASACRAAAPRGRRRSGGRSRSRAAPRPVAPGR